MYSLKFENNRILLIILPGSSFSSLSLLLMLKRVMPELHKGGNVAKKADIAKSKNVSAKQKVPPMGIEHRTSCVLL